ncbi:MAG: Nif3-like dinuclear metal center hexameric protein [Flavobacteriales bacterium]|nr:Nif3-like dinuclear metal center hexameric protein [Flavobacteriales bacterium]
MRIRSVIEVLEHWAPRPLQEDYDNCGLHVGDPDAEVKAALVCLDCTEAVVEEAAARGCGLIISHHPVIFKGLKSLVARSGVERTLLAAIRHGIALYAIHTNLDNVLSGVNHEVATRLGLHPLRVLDPKPDQLRKLVVFVPQSHAEPVRQALFKAGAGRMGSYDECSYSLDGQGTFRAGAGADPYVGSIGQRHTEPEVRVEVILETHRAQAAISAMKAAHPYEAVAYDLYPLGNRHAEIGSGLLGELEKPVDGPAFIALLKQVFGTPVVRHTALPHRQIRRVAVCGGAGGFLIGAARAAGADAFVTADLKYHQFFEPDGQLLLADVGHYESEHFTMHLIQGQLKGSLPTFAVHLTETVTNPLFYS